MRAELEGLTDFMEEKLNKIKESQRQRADEEAAIDAEVDIRGK